jgi:LmbE family N-acetylglucosaminyl deacetylase
MRSSHGSRHSRDVSIPILFSHDHRHVCRLTWNTFRDHRILEYEIPKWDGDIGQPNLYVPISANALKRKIDLLISHFGSQRSKQWFERGNLSRVGSAERY